MKKLISIVICSAFVMPALAAPQNNARVGRSNATMVGAGSRGASTSSMATMTVSYAKGNTSVSTDKSSNRVEPVTKPVQGAGQDSSSSVSTDPETKPETKPVPTPDADAREKEKNACLNNNIGVSNTFVWASRSSNLNDYSTMVEDIENPENNTCFVRVEMKSDDAKISLDEPAKYFEMGNTITCGSWVDEGKIKQKILDSKKKGRGWAIAGAGLGGAAVGVGVMEAVGNKALAGMGAKGVMGQKGMDDRNELLFSQLRTWKNKNNDKDSKANLEKAQGYLETLCGCQNITSDTKPYACSEYHWNEMLGEIYGRECKEDDKGVFRVFDKATTTTNAEVKNNTPAEGENNAASNTTAS